MRIVSYILLTFAVFIIGLALYFIVDDRTKEEKRVNASLEKARAAKKAKALKTVPDIDDDFEEQLENFQNQVIEETNGTTEKNE